MAFLQRTMNRGSVSTGFNIDNSVKLEADNDERFTRTPSSAGNRKTWTFSAWVKRTELGANQILISAADTYLYFGSDDKIHCNFRPASENFFLSTNRLFRDTSAWYHIVVQCDTTDGTAADRAKLYINGVRETSYSSSTYGNMSQNLDTSMNNTIEHMIGRYSSSDDYRMSGYISEFHLVDGTALTPTSFGEYDDDSGIWKPKAFSGSYGTNGFYLDFADAADLGDDESGNGNDWTETNITSADQSTDTPTNNFCTLNSIFFNTGGTSGLTGNYMPITEGGTLAWNGGNNHYAATFANMGVSSGKWYWEVKVATGTANGYVTGIGVGYPYTWDTNYSFNHTTYNYDAVRYNASGSSSFGATYGNGDIIGLALDMDASTPTLTVYKNGTSQGNLYSGLSIGGTGTAYLPPKEDFYFPYATSYGARTLEFNFGGYTVTSISSGNTDENGYGTFEYAPPSGYYALCGKNLAEFGGSA